MNNIDFLIKQQNLYGSKQKQFFLRKSIKLDEEFPSSQGQTLISPRKQNKFILQLQDVDLSIIRKALMNEYFIEILELRECRLKCVPIQILQMERLKVLKLESNYIKEAPTIEVETLSLKNNLLIVYHAGQSVIKLDISMNKIKEFSVGDKLQDLIIYANEFIQLPKLSQSLKTLELDWFKYTEPPMKPLQIQPLIAAMTVQSFSAIEFLNYYSIEQIKNKIKEAAIASDLGIVTSMAQCMDINEGEQDTALSLALKTESLFAVRHLLELGADINKGYYPQGNILSYCIEQELPSIINIILGRCTKEIFSVDNVGNSPLHYLSKVQYDESTFKILMKAKQLEIQLQQNMLGQSPIYLAIIKFKNQLLRLFLSNFEFDASDLFNATAKSENWEACLILIEYNVDFLNAHKLQVVHNLKFYKTLQCYEYFWIRQYILREQPKLHFNYEVKLLSKGNKIIKTENSYLRQLRQFVMFKSIFNKQQKQFLIQQMSQRLNDVLNQNFDYFQILSEIVLTLHFQIDKSIQDHLYNMLQHYKIGQEYLYKYIRRPFKPIDIQLQYEYYQQ